MTAQMNEPSASGAPTLRIVVGASLLAVLVLTLLIGAFAPMAVRAAFADGGVSCVFRDVTGLSCPFCGMTHATLALGHGNVLAGLSAHPLSPFILLATAWAALALLRGRIPTVMKAPLTARAVLLATALVWVVRLLSDSLA